MCHRFFCCLIPVVADSATPRAKRRLGAKRRKDKQIVILPSNIEIIMRISRATIETCGTETETVVAIDVLRAFTTSAFAFEAGATEIILVSSVEDAFKVKNEYPDALIMGENEGYPVEGFDLTNSPSALINKNLSGVTLIHRTTAGTQGVIRSSDANCILVTGLCNVSATVRRIESLSPKSLTLIETGVFPDGWGDEDVACADFIEAQLRGDSFDLGQVKSRVRESKSGMHYTDPTNQVFPPSDLELALDINRFNFSMEVEIEDGLHVLRSSL